MHFRLRYVEVIGKQGKKVPIILTEDMVTTIEILIKTRTEAGIPAENPYLFASTSQNGHLKTGDALKKAAEEAGVAHPELITSTRLRKYLAIVTQVVIYDMSYFHLVQSNLCLQSQCFSIKYLMHVQIKQLLLEPNEILCVSRN